MFKLPLLAIAVGGLALSACTDGYGYSGVSLGYGGGYGGYGGYADGYGYDGYGYGSAFGSPYWGWYGDYYYPGTGYYVYDRYRRPYRWNDGQRAYWEGRRRDWRGDRRQVRDNWGDYGRGDRDGRWDGNGNGTGYRYRPDQRQGYRDGQRGTINRGNVDRGSVLRERRQERLGTPRSAQPGRDFSRGGRRGRGE